LLQVFPARRLQEIASGSLPDQLVEWNVPGAFPLPQLSRRERIGTVGRLLSCELEVMARYFPQLELALLPAERLLDTSGGVLRVPCAAGLRMHAVDRQVDMRVFLVTMRDHQHLVLLQPEIREHSIGHTRHRAVIYRVAMIEGD
jgi:hypothetical protein